MKKSAMGKSSMGAHASEKMERMTSTSKNMPGMKMGMMKKGKKK